MPVVALALNTFQKWLAAKFGVFEAAIISEKIRDGIGAAEQSTLT